MWSKTLKISFEEIDKMELEFLLDLVATQNKLDEALDPDNRIYSIDEVLPI